ncbi:polyketide synthase, type I [Legionella spiritensis]|nr:polyketide synthase, type I [Legionella spiritensis]
MYMVKKNQPDNVKGVLKEPVAIVGMNCRFPGIATDVDDIHSFYEMLIQGLTPIKEVPGQRWNSDEYYDADRSKPDKIVTKLGGFLKNVHLFDADFFRIPPVEAKQMDPQHRLFLEVAIRALNHANITLRSLNGSNTGVYCGISSQDYSHLNYKDNIRFNEYTQIGAANSAAAGRLSHFLNLKGPSLVVDTACSSSLSALYLAATALATRQCDMAIVGGVHLNLCPENFIGLTKANMLSARGQCSSFDRAADGFVRSEGCGVVIVKRLGEALKDRNTIHALIRSVVMNQDGDGTTLVAPNLDAQIAMHRAALEQANLRSGDIDYIETHGTGTVVGDSVEFNAIRRVHEGHHRKEKPLVLGALKSNLGHTIASSGIASLVKVIGAMSHETIPPNLHYSTPNDSIEPDSIPALFPVQATPFRKQKNKRRYAQVSNFGFSGTNVSAIVEEAPDSEIQESLTETTEPQCFVLSANSDVSLKQMMATYVRYLQESRACLSDICYTLINGRDHYKYRCAIIAPDKDTLIKKINAQEYDLHKVTVKKSIKTVRNDAREIYEHYMSGATIILDGDETHGRHVDLPLYCFDGKPYWHEPGTTNTHWLDALYHQSKEQRVTAIKTRIADMVQTLLKKERVNEYHDFEILGFTEPLLEVLDQKLHDLLSPRVHIPDVLASFHFSIDKLARHLYLRIYPATVVRQPSINVLNTEPIAIIGMSCRFPKASNLDAFLSLLENGESGMADIPLERWDNEKYYDPDVNALGRLYIKQLGLIGDIKKFDAEFFNVSPREARFMSPQLRVFMETCYHAIEHANLSLDAIKDSKTGVFVGVGTNEYPKILANQGVSLEDLNIYFATGNVLNALAGRVAYTFDLHGPIQAVDTACSSSMTAIHNACLSLQSGDCNMALAGGVNILLTPDSNITLSKARMLSPESRCKTFSDDADGYARSEGCGVVVLKRLSTAIKDNDTVLAVIKGTAVNSDGKSGGFTVPNGIAQEEVIRAALAKAKLSPADIDCIEAHGTGTPLADPIEVNTLTRIFSDSHSVDKPLYISSVKTNIGHSESAAGVASVIKAVLSLNARKVFKHLNFKKLNPEIDLKNAVIPLRTVDWLNQRDTRYVGVSSFGFSGANAHVILQQAPERETEHRSIPGPFLLVLSAKSERSLDLLLSSYQNYLSDTKDDFSDICYTAATCRNHFLFRVAIKADTARQAAAIIAAKQYAVARIKKEKEAASLPHTVDQFQTAYQEGFAINWSDYYQSFGHAFHKVNLPLYEFDREIYWVEKTRLKDDLIPRDWGFRLQWQERPCDKNNSHPQENNWLLMGDRQLASGFRKQGLQIVLEEEGCGLDTLQGIIFAVGLDSPPIDDIDANIDFQKNALKKLLNLVKQLHQQGVALRLMVLTTNAIAELAVGELNISHSPFIGFCKTLALELPQCHTILVDGDDSHDERYFAQVVDEIHCNHGAFYEQMVAYRSGRRMTPRLLKIALTDKKRSLYGQGRYLVTGGGGGLGLVTAQALLSAGARELVLISRHIDKPAIKTAIGKIQQDFPGRVIRTISVDVTDKKALCALFSDINPDGLLKGIIHTAGAAVKAPLVEHQEKDVDYLFEAKVRGAWYLHELSQSCHLDFFVVYSSIAAVFGSNKESVYSAANSFLDVLIAERLRRGLPGTAIQWGPWGEVGMANERARNPALKQALVTNEQGHALIKVLINGQFDHVAIISPDYLTFMLDFVPKPQSLFYKDLADDLAIKEVVLSVNNDLSPWLNGFLKVDPDKRLQACKDMIGAVCKEILELPDTEELEEDEGFFEIGFDSLMIAEMASELKKKLEPTVKVMVNIGFDYPSINKLANYMASELDKKLVTQQQPHVAAEQKDEAIAIIGMSCSFPEAPDVAAFETLLEQGLNGIRDIPPERWDNSKYYDPDMDAPGKSYVNKLGLIDNIKGFDAGFFGISPREAKLMEPQQRLFLECSYKALENANYPPSSLRGSLTGVFAGVGPNEYYAKLEKSGFSNEELSAFSITGNVLNLIPGRVAYTFDLKGPSLSIDTACSSSLVAIHYACRSLNNHEIDYALAGGVNVLLMPESNVTLCKAKALSPDGQCKTFDKNANGYVRAEGCGVIVLKRLADAKRDKDHILAVIKASAVNNDGKSAGLTVPNGKSQEAVMQSALLQSGLSAHDISYIEAHGTGTPLGDPIEVHAINNVYGCERGQDNPLYLGAVKTNIGHLESASGIASLVKTVLGLQQKKIYKNLHFHQLNPNIKPGDTQFALQTITWERGEALRCAGVNAFGFSGTNAHVILQEFPDEAVVKTKAPIHPYVLVLSAKSRASLDDLSRRYQQYLETTGDDFGEICFTAALCREHYPYRLAVAAKTAAEASCLMGKGAFALSSHGNDQPLDLPEHGELRDLTIRYLQGEQVDWASYYKSLGQAFEKVVLPNYPFHRVEFWPDEKSDSTTPADIVHPLLGQMFSLPGNEYLFNQKLDLQHLSYVKHHRVFDKIVFPATAYIEAGLAAAKAIFKRHVFCLEKFNIAQPLYPRQDQDFQLQVKVRDEERYQIRIFAGQDGQWQAYADMEIHKTVSLAPESVDLDALKSSFEQKVDLSQIYEHFDQRSLLYGNEFQVLKEGYVQTDRILTKVSLTKASHKTGYFYHPVLLDGAMQSILLLGINGVENTTYVPYAFTRLTVFQEAPGMVWAYVIKRNTGYENELCCDIKLYDSSGFLIGWLEGLILRKVTPNHFISYEFLLQHLYQITWSPLKTNITAQPRLPGFLVVSSDEARAKKILGNLDYQFVASPRNMEALANEHILFLYEQGQFQDLFQCCQALFKSRPASFTLVTENAYAIHPDNEVNPYHTMAGAFWRSFRNELDLGHNYAIDLGEGGTLPDPLNYLFNGLGEETQLAVRDALYLPRLRKKQPLGRTMPQAPLFDARASYLIVGGTGGLARPLMEYLIRRGVTEIILVSRADCAPDLRAFMDRAGQQKVRVSHYKADAGNYQQMEEVIATIHRDCKPLKGVFHLAGVIQDGLIVNLSDDDVQRVLSAKMDSALILHQLTKPIPLDMFVLFSSSASVLGARGQSNYVAANGFLDGLAHLRRRRGLPALAINWGPFCATGMTESLTGALQQHGFIPLDPDAIDVLDVLLTGSWAQIAPCPVHWDIYYKHVPRQRWLSDLVKNREPSSQHFLNALRELPNEGRIRVLNQTLCAITADVLILDSIEDIHVNDDLFAMGMDSLMAIEIRNRIHDKLQCPNLSLSIEYFIHDPTIDRIARNIAGELQQVLQPATKASLPEKSREEDVALCDFQYIFWVFNKLDYGFNIGMQLRLHGKLNQDYLFQAFDVVVRQHSAFWIKFNPEIPVQTLQRQGQFKVIYEDLSLSNEADILNMEFYNNIMRIIPLSQQPLIRVYLYKINNDLHELHLVIPHIIVDDASCDMVFNQFKESYKALTHGKKLLPVPEKNVYFDYVKNNNRHYEKNLSDKMDFWQAYNKSYSLLHFGTENHLPDAANQSQHLYHYPVESQLIEAFMAWHKAENINISTGIVAVCQMVFYKISRQNKIPVILIHSGREGSQYKSVVGLFSEYKRINITLNEHDRFIDLVTSIEEQLLKTAPYQKCSHFIKDSGLKGAGLSFAQSLVFAFNKLFLTGKFKESKLHKTIIDYYLRYLSRSMSNKKYIAIKYRLNKLFHLNIPLQKPNGLRILISNTPSFFSKESHNRRFADIDYTFSSHFGCMNRPIGNRTLWIYFSKNQYGDYQLSINGPLTVECKEQIANSFNRIVEQFLERNDGKITDLIRFS